MGRARGPTYRVAFRRRREGKTDYRRRLKLLVSRKHRVVVRRSNRYVRMQLIAADKLGDKTLVSAQSSDLKLYGYEDGLGNTPASYLTGLLLGKRAVKAGYGEAILDKGLLMPVHGSSIYVALLGAVDGGLSIPHEQVVFPADERISGNHIASYKNDPSLVDRIKNVKEMIMSDKLQQLHANKEDQETE